MDAVYGCHIGWRHKPEAVITLVSNKIFVFSGAAKENGLTLDQTYEDNVKKSNMADVFPVCGFRVGFSDVGRRS